MDHEDGVQLVKDVAGVIARDSLPGPAMLIANIVQVGLKAAGGSGTDRLREAVQAEIEDAVLRLLPEVQRRVERLEAEGKGVNSSDFARVLGEFGRSWTRAGDARKRKLLEAAFVRSFDPDMYESGVLDALWSALDRLSYGDLFVLRELGDAGQGAASSVQKKHEFSNGRSLGRFHATNLLREQLCWSPSGRDSPDGAGLTDLGQRLYELALQVQTSASTPASTSTVL